MAEAMTAPVDSDLVFDDPDWDAFVKTMEATWADGQADIDSRIDYYFEKIRESQAEIERNDEVAHRRTDIIADWCAGEKAKVERRIGHMTAMIGTLVPPSVDAMQAEYGKKSRALPNGTFGYRARPDSVDISDPKEALAFAVTNNLPVKTVHSVSKTSLKDHATATGETEGDGWRMVIGADEFFVKAAK